MIERRISQDKMRRRQSNQVVVLDSTNKGLELRVDGEGGSGTQSRAGARWSRNSNELGVSGLETSMGGLVPQHSCSSYLKRKPEGRTTLERPRDSTATTINRSRVVKLRVRPTFIANFSNQLIVATLLLVSAASWILCGHCAPTKATQELAGHQMPLAQATAAAVILVELANRPSNQQHRASAESGRQGASAQGDTMLLILANQQANSEGAEQAQIGLSNQKSPPAR